MLNNDYKEFIKLLNKNNVKYLVVGGYALAFHGYPRYTKDIDIWIWLNKENSEKIIKTLREFGFDSLDLTSEDFMQSGTVIQLGKQPNRIDLLTSVTGLDFDECYSSRDEIDIDDTKVCFVDKENFKKNKKAVGRHQDLADLENLEE